MSILSLADDMTGALEVGVKFRDAGLRSIVSARPAPTRSAPVVVLDTETRHTGPEAAQREVKRFVRESCDTQPVLIYKKTDSTLRGNIAAELHALAELFPEWRIGYAPAYPALGRTVKQGMLYVNDVPVSETAFAYDALNPIRDSAISSILHPQLSCTVFDGETDEDLAAAARVILCDARMRIAAGPAGLAEALARQIEAPREPAVPRPAVRSCLLINGSRHEMSRSQIEHAEMQGCASVHSRSAWNILKTSQSRTASPAEVASENAARAVRHILEDAPDAILVIGGDTAFAVVSALGLPPITPICEVLPGVPVSRIDAGDISQILAGRTRDLLLITKAGGFGSPDTICQVRARLNGTN